jgi:NAD(P)-dependent dehydrogenase (short-subunit alcohol dehydrogenase family)
MRRMGHPGDMASAILFLSSEAASFVHGSTLDVDGGGMLR